jgi:hypothetical protein
VRENYLAQRRESARKRYLTQRHKDGGFARDRSLSPQATRKKSLCPGFTLRRLGNPPSLCLCVRIVERLAALAFFLRAFAPLRAIFS